MLSIALAAALAQAPAQPALPAPTGPLAVATAGYVWTDSARTDSLAPGGAGPRTLVVQAWYPTAPGRYPVIVFSTGRSTATSDYTALLGELASRGNVVVGVNSPGHSRFVLPDGRTIPPGPAPPRAVLEQFDRADAFLEPMNRAVSADMRFVVRTLARVDRDDPALRGRLDLGRLGMMGHSNGAMAGARACAEEPACRAYLGIEGTQTREVRKNGVAKPYALLISEQSLSYDRENVYRELLGAAHAPYLVARVNGAGHNSATDLTLTRPELFAYPMAAARGVELARAVATAFFARTLGAPTADAATALDGLAARFPELRVEGARPPAGGADTLRVVTLPAAPRVDGAVSAAEYGEPALTLGVPGGTARVWLAARGRSVVLAAQVPDTSVYWGDDVVLTVDVDGSGGAAPGDGDLRWVVRRTADSSVVTRAEGGRWEPAGGARAIGAARAGAGWRLATASTAGGWSLELELDAALLAGSGGRPATAALRVTDVAGTAATWAAWPAPPAGVPPTRVERMPTLWRPVVAAPR